LLSVSLSLSLIAHLHPCRHLPTSTIHRFCQYGRGRRR
jgi:hypothetical protein